MTLRARVCALVVSLFLCSTAPVLGQVSRASEPDVPEKVDKELHAYRITGRSPDVDGRLDDDVWSRAAAIDDFRQGEPDNMAPPTERTTVQVAYDASTLYVAVHAYMANPSDVAAGLGRRDNFPASDRISLFFDPRHDHLTGYVFEANPSGVEGDYTLFDDTGRSFDYDGVWDVRTQLTPDGWTAEFQIPLSQMRFLGGDGEESVWGFNVQRQIYRKAEDASWVAAPRGAVGNVSRFGHLVFDEPLAASRRLEVSPFVVTRSDRPNGLSATNEMDGGLDVRYGLGSSATLSMTINPDFGQVEQDPAVLNLSVFETQYSERRPFFLEDSRTFVLPYGQLPSFYSPRIGRRPARYPLEAGDSLIHRPDLTTILGAAKLTGGSGDWRYGVLSAFTDQEYALVDHTDTTSMAVTRTERLLEPRTVYNVARLQRNILGGTSNMGVIGTAVVRDKDLDAYTGGVDAVLRWDRNRYFLNNFWVLTRAPFGTEERLGFGGATNFGFQSRRLRINGHFDHFSESFRNTDLGFLTSRPDKTNVFGGFTLVRPDPWKAVRNASAQLGFDQTWNGDGLNIGRALFANTSTQLTSFWSINTNWGYDFESLSDLDTRGGPPIVVPSYRSVNVNVVSDSRRTWSVNFGGSLSSDVESGWDRTGRAGVSVQPSGRFQASVSARYTAGIDPAQWIRNGNYDGDPETDYVFGRLRRDVIDLTLRGTFAFTRDLTLEMYMQPFVSIGHYDDIKELANPSSFDFTPITLPFDPDFSRRSLQSNLVLRWEYLSGSTLYLVWQSAGTDRSDPGVFEAWDDLGDSFSGPRDDVFILKATYWLDL